MAAGDDSSVNLASPTGNADTRLTAGGDQRQVVTVGNAGDTVAGLEPFGALQVNNGYTTLFYDAWSAALDTVDKWTVTGTSPSISGGNMTMSPVLSTYHAIRTKDTVVPNAGFTLVRNGIALEASAAAGAGRFWGLGTTASTPSATSLAQDGIGFEVDQATGALLAVTYAAGVRTTVATLTRPSDGASHAYHLYFRVTQAYWFIDNTQVAVASLSWPTVQVAELPALIVRNNAASFTGTPVFVNIAHLTADTSRQGLSLADPVIGTRMARIDAAGRLWTRGAPSATSTLTSVTAAAASTAILAANPNRTGALLYNASTAILYLGLTASAVTTSAYSVQIPAGGYYELPPGLSYTGALTGIWSAANGAVKVTEMVA